MIEQQQALDWIAKVFREPPGKLTPETRRLDVEDWDSLGVLTLMASLDSDFGITLSDEQLQDTNQVGDILQILRSNGALK
jgi:acyl carrier protein